MSELNEKELEQEEFAKQITDDFLRRRQERKILERGWQLNMNFVSGNQYCDLDYAGEICEEEKKYFWQSRKVFNHIAPIIDTRLSKLARIRPALVVRAASDDESDRHSAALASSILAAVQESEDFDGVVSAATLWSEICGTAFYKILWNSEGGRCVGATEDGNRLHEGDVKVAALSPFEIYPYSLSVEKLEDQPSIIHAKALPVQDIYAMYGVKFKGSDIGEFSYSPHSQISHSYGHMQDFRTVMHDCELVIERYERPTVDRPAGRFTVVAGGKVLFDGDLPYVNGDENTRGYPFIKQTALPLAGNFFGTSVVDRLIPLQRAYNALKNRKQEFLNRIAMGTVAVEDGSVDLDELSEDGLAPGKVLVYRHGGKPPEMLALGSVPDEFFKEEETLLNEFNKISGTGDLTENADSFSGITSATGLQLIIDQDDMRLKVTYTEIKRAVRQIGRHVLRLYRQFASDVRLMKYAGENNVLNLFYFKGSDISSDDVSIEADSELNMTPAQKRTVIYEILEKGLFTDSEGRLSISAKNKLLDMLGYGSLAGDRDLSELNRARAGEENLKMRTGSAEVKDYDEHRTHITEHTAFLLTEKLTKDAERRICAHMEVHKAKLKESEQSEVKS